MSEKSIPELRAEAAELGINIKGNLGREKLLLLIENAKNKEIEKEKMEELFHPPENSVDYIPKANDIIHPTPKHQTTDQVQQSTAEERQDQIIKALTPFINDGLGLEMDDLSWTISYNGRVISGTLFQPDYIIVRQIHSFMMQKIA